MGQNVSAEDLLTEIESLKRQVRALQTSPRMFATTQHGGTYELDDETGTLAYFNFGSYLDKNGNPQFGMWVSGTGDPDERTLELGSNGLHIPAMNMPMLPVNGNVVINSATYVDAFQSGYFAVTANAFKSGVFAQGVDGLSGGTLSIYGPPGGPTADVTIPVGTGGAFVTFNWLHGAQIGAGPINFIWQAKSTGNGIRVFQPTTSFMVNGDYIAATATGI